MKRLLLLSLVSCGAIELAANQSCPRGQELRRKMSGQKHCVDVSDERSLENIQSCHSTQKYVCQAPVEGERGKAKCRCVNLKKAQK